jgi:NAD(P)-dependent dehydrogenase (short-subunit alcohol dehydrogenase family)
MSEVLSFDGRVAIVTGAGRGLGRVHALSLAERGAQVVVNDLGPSDDGSTPAAQSVADEIVAAGGEAVANTESVATPEGGQAIVDTALNAFGRVDIVVNNAGILRDKTFHNLAPEDIRSVIDVHLLGAFWVTQPAFALMRQQGYGRIVMTTSAAGLFGNFGQTNYAAAKAGLVGLARALAQEGRKRGVNVNVFAPIARTRMTDELLGSAKELLAPELASPAAIWLCHEECPVTGHIISSFGGRVASVFVGVSEGVILQDPRPEDVRDSFEAIQARGEFVVPRTTTQELRLLLDAKGVALT